MTHLHGTDQTTLCGQNGGHCYTTTADRSAVDCKRCLASLAKRDRAFQRKARGWFKRPRYRDAIDEALHAGFGRPSRREIAARAVALEEGRV